MDRTTSPEPPPAPRPVRRSAGRFRWTAFAIGLLCGAVSAALGISAGIMLVPLAVFLLRLDRGEATGTCLTAILAITAAGAVVYHAAGTVHHEAVWGLRAVLAAAFGEIIGALAGARLGGSFRAGWPRRLLGILLAATGMWLITRMASAAEPAGASALANGAGLFTAGFIAGALSGVAGIGGDLLVPPLLVLLLGYPQRLAQGLSLAVIPLASLLGMLLHLRRGNVVLGLVGWLAAGGVIGAVLVAQQIDRIPPDLLRGAFGALLIGVGVSVVQRAAGKEVAG